MGRFYAVVHVHSTWSYDGRWPLERIARTFARRGRGAVLMTEHDRGFDETRWTEYRRACAQVSSERLLVVPGIEYSDEANTVHLLVWGELPFLGEGRPSGEILSRVREFGGVAILAHPRRRDAWSAVAPEWLQLLRGVELWSRKYDGWAPGRTPQELFPPGEHLVPFVGLDFHSARQFFPLSMVIDVAGPRTEAAVVESLRAGRCRPVAFRLPALAFTRGPGRFAAICAEGVRLALRRVLRPRLRP